MQPNLFEAWDGLVVSLSRIHFIEYRPAQPRCAGVTIPAGVVVNGDFYPNRGKDDYNRLRDAAIAYEQTALASAKGEPAQIEREAA